MADLVEKLREKASDAVDWHGATMKRWDEIRGTVEIRKGSDLPRLMFEDLMEDFAELLNEAANEIEDLRQQPQRS